MTVKRRIIESYFRSSDIEIETQRSVDECHCILIILVYAIFMFYFKSKVVQTCMHWKLNFKSVLLFINLCFIDNKIHMLVCSNFILYEFNTRYKFTCITSYFHRILAWIICRNNIVIFENFLQIILVNAEFILLNFRSIFITIFLFWFRTTFKRNRQSSIICSIRSN